MNYNSSKIQLDGEPSFATWKAYGNKKLKLAEYKVQNTDKYQRGVGSRVEALRAAISAYDQAIDYASKNPYSVESNKNLAIGHKNRGIANFKACKHMLANQYESNEPKDVLNHLYHAIVNVQEAAILGKLGGQSETWIDGLDELLLHIVREVREHSDVMISGSNSLWSRETIGFDKDYAMKLLQRLGTAFRKTVCTFPAQLANEYRFVNSFNASVKWFEEGDLKMAEYYVVDAEEGLRSFIYFTGDDEKEVLGDNVEDCSLEEWLERLMLQKAQIDSVKARDNAKANLHDLIYNQDFEFNAVWIIADQFQKARILANEGRDVENEAHALCELGGLFDEIFKLEVYADNYFHMCVQLGNSYKDRKNLTNTEWFKKAKEYVVRKKLQADNAAQKSAKEAKEAMLATLQPEMEEIKAKATAIAVIFDNAKAFLIWTYEKYPPRLANGATYNLPGITESNVKSVLQRAIVHFHPDKNVAQDLRYKCIAEELTKRVVRMYEQYK